jgi:hypothetical protein
MTQSKILEESNVLRRDAVEEHLVRQCAALEIELEPGVRDGLTKSGDGFCGVAANRLEGLHAQKPRVTAMVAQSSKEPLLVIAHEAHDLGGRLAPEAENRFHATSRIAPSVDIVAEEDDAVILAGLTSNLVEQVGEGREVAMDVTDRDRGHGEYNSMR